MAPLLHSPPPRPAASHVVFVPVDGRVVFAVCVVLVLACLIEFGLRLHKGVEADK